MKQPDIETAIKIYYTYTEIGNKEIRELFGSVSSATTAKLKKKARDIMIKDNIYVNGKFNVHTKSAYEAWKIDVEDCKKRLKALKDLGMYQKAQ